MESRTRPIPTSTSITRPGTRRREVEYKGLTWIDLPQPVNADVAYLRERLKLDPLALDDALSTIQRPKLDVHATNEYLFVVIQVPILNRDNRIVVNEVDVFAGRDFVVTLHDGNLKPLRRLFSAAAADETARGQLLGRGPGYLLYRVLDTLIKQSFPVVYHTEEELTRFDERLFAEDARKLLRVGVLLQRDTIALRHILEPNLAVCDLLRTLDLPFLRIDAARFFGDCADGMHKLYGSAVEQHEVVTSLSQALDTLSVQQQSASLRNVHVLLLILLPIVLLAAISALYIAAPLQTQPLVFGGAILAMLAIIGGLLAYGRSRRWF
jgi:magnesium transporter